MTFFEEAILPRLPFDELLPCELLGDGDGLGEGHVVVIERSISDPSGHRNVLLGGGGVTGPPLPPQLPPLLVSHNV